MLGGVKEWRPPSKRGKKLYDDKSFVDSLREQYARRHSLSTRQALALRRVVTSYREQIPDFAARAAELGLETENVSKRR